MLVLSAYPQPYAANMAVEMDGCKLRLWFPSRYALRYPLTSTLEHFANVGAAHILMKNVLFICGQNRLRSPMAEQVFSSYPRIECSSAGLNHDAETPVTPELVKWAEIIFVMEKTHRNKLTSKFRKHLNNKRIICLDIPDDYEFMDPVLVKLLKAKVTRHLPS
ncbi:MAG: hypothetical protein JWN23_3092 [Rhodocyclales bacterium]|nr:hypothetical protein [Rhodocyclales bacterium]